MALKKSVVCCNGKNGAKCAVENNRRKDVAVVHTLTLKEPAGDQSGTVSGDLTMFVSLDLNTHVDERRFQEGSVSTTSQVPLSKSFFLFNHGSSPLRRLCRTHRSRIGDRFDGRRNARLSQ